MQQRIHELKKDTRVSFQKYTEKLLNVDAVEQMIRKKYSDKKDAKEYLSGYILEQLQNEAQSLIKVNSEKLIPEIEAFLGSYQEALLKLPNLDISIHIPWDAQGSFIGGLAGLTSIGALSAWAATLGNLGGYILIAKLVSLLSALGISLGGTAAVIAFIAAIGGPIVLAVGLAAALAFALGSLFGESWEKRLAKQTVRYFEEQHVNKKFLEGIEQFWQDTTKSFDKGANAVEADWDKYVQHIREITSPKTDSKERIEEIIKKLELGKKFFAGIPWFDN